MASASVRTGQPVHGEKSTSWLGKVFELNPAGINWPRAVTVLDVLMVPLVVFWAIGHQEYLLSAIFGVVFTTLADPGGSYGYRVSHIAVFGLIGAGLTALGFGIGGDAWGWLVLAAGVVTLVAGLAVMFGVHRFVTAYLLNVQFIIALVLAAEFHKHAHITSYTWAQVLAWANADRPDLTPLTNTYVRRPAGKRASYSEGEEGGSKGRNHSRAENEHATLETEGMNRSGPIHPGPHASPVSRAASFSARLRSQTYKRPSGSSACRAVSCSLGCRAVSCSQASRAASSSPAARRTSPRSQAGTSRSYSSCAAMDSSLRGTFHCSAHNASCSGAILVFRSHPDTTTLSPHVLPLLTRTHRASLPGGGSPGPRS